MEIVKNAIEDCNLIGISSQKKGRFIIQEIEEENNKEFFSPKKYSFDAKRTIFTYYTYEYSSFHIQIDNNNNYNINIKSKNDLDTVEKRNRISSLNSKKECFSFTEATNNYNKENSNKKKTSDQNYFYAEIENKNNNNNNSNYNNINNSLIQIKTYVLNFEEENFNFLNFDLIWKQFIKINNINLFNYLDNRIFSYKKSSPEIMPKIAKKPSSIFSSEHSSQKSQEACSQNLDKTTNIKKGISNLSLKKFNRNNSEIKSLTNKNENFKFPRWNQSLEKIKKRTLSGERMSFFKRNSINTICSSITKKMINFNNAANSEKEKKISNMNYAFSNKNIIALHWNFKSDLEINYGLEENEDTESMVTNRQNKKLSEKEIIQSIPITNKTESISFKKKVHENFKIEAESKEADSEVDIDFFSSKDSDSKLNTENKDNSEQESNNKIKKSYFFPIENETFGFDKDNEKNNFKNDYNYKKVNRSNEEFDNEDDILYKFHSLGFNLENKRKIYIEDELEDKGFTNFNPNKENTKNTQKNSREEQESDLLISKVNFDFDFDFDKNKVSDVNPFLKEEGKNDFKCNNKKVYCNEIQMQEKIRKEKDFEKELNEINERNAKKKNLAFSTKSLEDLLRSRSPLEILNKKNQENYIEKNGSEKYENRNWILDINIDPKENTNQHLFKKYFNLQKQEKVNSEFNGLNKLEIFSLEEEEDHLYYSCSSINSPESKAIAKHHQKTKLSDPLKARIKPIIAESDNNKFSTKKNKSVKIKFSNLGLQKEKQIIQSSPIKYSKLIPKYKLNDKFNQKFKNSNNVKLNIIKSIEKSFVEDEKQKMGIYMSRINSADRKLNCVKLIKTEIEKAQFEILPCVVNINDDNKDGEYESSEDFCDSCENLEVVKVISIELLGEKDNKNTKKEVEIKEHFCNKCKEKES
jgi:hypothetical protein